MTLMGHAAPPIGPVAWLGVGIGYGTGGGAMRENLDDRIHDVVALDEIDLYAEVLSAVAATDRRLTEDELDEVLGLRRIGDPASRTLAQPA